MAKVLEVLGNNTDADEPGQRLCSERCRQYCEQNAVVCQDSWLSSVHRSRLIEPSLVLLLAILFSSLSFSYFCANFINSRRYFHRMLLKLRKHPHCNNCTRLKMKRKSYHCRALKQEVHPEHAGHLRKNLSSTHSEFHVDCQDYNPHKENK